MNISYTSDARYDIGEPVPVPADLKKYQLNWNVEPMCKRYPFGYLYLQEFSTPRFDMALRIHKMDEAGQLYINEDSPCFCLYFMLKGHARALLPPEREIDVPAKSCGIYYATTGKKIMCLSEGIHQILSIRLKPSYSLEISDSGHQIPAIRQMLQEPPATDIPIVQTSITHEINQEIMKLLQTNAGSVPSLFKIYSSVDTILSHCFSAADQQDKTEDAVLVRIAERLRDAIVQNPIDTQSLKSIAIEHKMDAQKIYKVYKSKYNEKLSDTKKERLMLKAMTLITETNKTIEEISIEMGYSDRRAFSRAVKKELGYTPEQLRAVSRSQNMFPDSTFDVPVSPM